MDSHNPYVYGAVEECNSCESGWTMYIGSPTGKTDEENISYKKEYDDDDDDDDGYGYGYVNIKHGDDDHQNSDDSMVSDASSGPSHKGQSWEITSSGRKKCESKVVHHRRSSYRAEVPAKKNIYVKGNIEEDKFVGNSVKKVGKNHGFGKRK